MNQKLSLTSVTFIILLSIGLSNHVLIIPLLLQEGKRDSWVGVIIGTVLASLWTIIPYFIMHKLKSQSVRSWMREHYGRFIPAIILGLAMILIWGLLLISVTSFISWTKTYFLIKTPTFIIVLSLITICTYIALNRLNSISIVAGILCPIVVILGITVSLGNMKMKDYSRLTPLFIDGYHPTLSCILITLGGMFQLFIFVFIHHHFAIKPKRLFLFIIMLVLGDLIFGPLVGSISAFGPSVSGTMNYPAFEQWRLLTISRYITHTDFFALFQWISGIVVQVSLFLFIMAESLTSSRVKEPWIVIVFGALTIVFLSVPFIIKSIEDFFSYYYWKMTFWSFLSLSFLMLLMVLFQPKSKVRSSP